MKKHKKVIGLVLGLVLLLIITFIPAPEPLTRQSMFSVGMLVAAITWMSFGSMPDYVALLFCCCCWVISGILPIKSSFGIFATSSWWLLVGALALGAAADESGLLRRLSYYMMRLFKPTYKGQSAGLLLTGLVVGPLIPSTTAKGAILGPLARGISDELGYEHNSRGAAGLFAAFYNGVCFSCPMFLSSSFFAYTCLATLPEGTAPSWIQWFLYALPWSIIVILPMFFVGRKMYKPEREVEFSKDFINQKIVELGPWTRNEKITLAVLIGCLLMWMTERIHGIDSSMTACIGTCIVLICGVYDRNSFRSKISWDNTILVGCMLAFATVFSVVGINDFIQIYLGPIIAPLMNNMWIFIPVYCIFIFAIRYLLPSWNATITIVSVVLYPLCETVGVSPFVIIFICYCCLQTWNTVYQTSIYITARVATGNVMGSHAQMRPFSWCYMLFCTLGCTASIPFWHMFGLL